MSWAVGCLLSGRSWSVWGLRRERARAREYLESGEAKPCLVQAGCIAALTAAAVGRVGASDFLSASAMIPTDARPRQQDAAHRCSSCRWANWLRSFALLAISKIIINEFYSLFGCVMTAFY